MKTEELVEGGNNRFKRIVVKAVNRSTLLASSSKLNTIIKPKFTNRIASFFEGY